MLPPCAQCGAVLLEGARFCGSCGVAIPEIGEAGAPPELAEDAAAIARYRGVLDRFLHDGPLESHELEQLEALRQRLSLSLRTHERLYAELTSGRSESGAATAAGGERGALRLFLDTETVRHFVAGARCVLRLKLVNDGPLLLESVAVYTEVLGGERLLPSRGEPVFPGKSGLLTVWLVPQLPGFCEVRGIVHVVDLAGTASAFRFDGVQFRVGALGEAAPVSVVNIDQRSARVVDNSRTQFAAPPPDRGGLVGEGDFKPVPLRPLPLAEAAALWPELYVPTAPPQSDGSSDARSDGNIGAARGPTLRRGAPVRFTVKGEAAMYEASSVLTQGDLATLYEGRRTRDGAPVIIKIADDSADNDLMQAEVSALRILRAEPSPQLKHLPVVLDQLQTRDGRLGTVLERIDGLDLLQVRERRPRGLSAQHLIWIMRRCLSVLGWAHARGVLHGNLDPAHIVIRAQDHNVWVIDWCYAIVNPARTGQGFRVLNEEYSPPEVGARKPPLPSSDLYSLGRCMIYLLGGDPRQHELPRDAETGQELDERLQRFLRFFVLDSALGRAQDAWEAYRFLDRLRAQIWGPHRFIELLL